MKFVFTSILFLFSQACYSQSPEEIIESFFNAYKAKDVEAAINLLYRNSPDVHETREGMKRTLKSQLDFAGEYCGSNLLSVKTAGARARMYTYLVRHVNEPVTFRIFLYRPKDTWQLQSFKVSNDLATELEEASKAYRTDEIARKPYTAN